MVKFADSKSFHEAGHAVVARILGVEVSGITMRPSGADNTAGVETVSASWLARKASTSEQVLACENDALVALAGMAAQARSHPDLLVTTDNPEYQADIGNAQRMVANIVLLLRGEAVVEGERSPPLSGDDLKTAKVKFDQLVQKTYSLVREHWREIVRVAKALESRNQVDQAELDQLIERARRRANTGSS